MHPSLYAQTTPDKAALIMAKTGQIISYKQLDDASNRAANLFRSEGIQIGDKIAIMLENEAQYFEILWGAQRSGLYYSCISTKLTAADLEYIIRDSGAKLLVISHSLGKLADELAEILSNTKLFMIGGTHPKYQSWESASALQPTTRIADERAGADLFYSSGTTGRPKGIIKPIAENPEIAVLDPLTKAAIEVFGFCADTIYLSPAPLYHAAPLRWCVRTMKVGGTVIVMDKFDAEEALRLIDKYKPNTSQWVPTHFIRMLKLPDEVRAKYNVSSMKCAIHAAAPCPISVKEAMIAWWGPVICEYYAGTEGNGMTMIKTEDWLSHKGSVGTPVMGTPHIMDENQNEVGANIEGVIYFEGTAPFTYHNDPEKTAASRNDKGWSTLGDIGYLDKDGYLYLTDRQSFMIISGGVNIYPQEIENALAANPHVLDSAVIGAPDEIMGEKVVAVIQLSDPTKASDELRSEILQWLRPHLSGVKMPRQIDFIDELPRHATGKLYKRVLRDKYWAEAKGKVI